MNRENDLFLEEEETFGNTNDTKSLVSAFVRAILRNSSNCRKPLTQERIVAELERWPYGVSINRKAVARELETMMLVYPYIRRCPEGYYYDSRTCHSKAA